MITPHEILARNPAIRDTDEFTYWHSYYTTPLETMLATLEVMGEHTSLLDLDVDDNRELVIHGSNVLGQLGPEVVLSHYGQEGLVFVLCNTLSDRVYEPFLNALQNVGYKKELLQKARVWSYQKYHSSKVREVLSQYAVMETVTGDWLATVDLPRVLGEYLNGDMTLSDKRAADYTLLPLCSEDSKYEAAGWERNWARSFEPPPRKGHRNNKPFKRYSVWLDAPTGFALAYKGAPQALATVSCLGGRKLIINQLQGIRAELIDPKLRYSKEGVVGHVASRGLMLFDWRGVLVGIADRLAAELGMDALVIQGGENNVWRHKRLKGETSAHMSAEVAARAYDEPAERLGFIRFRDGNWHRPIMQ